MIVDAMDSRADRDHRTELRTPSASSRCSNEVSEAISGGGPATECVLDESVHEECPTDHHLGTSSQNWGKEIPFSWPQLPPPAAAVPCTLPPTGFLTSACASWPREKGGSSLLDEASLKTLQILPYEESTQASITGCCSHAMGAGRLEDTFADLRHSSCLVGRVTMDYITENLTKWSLMVRFPSIEAVRGSVTPSVLSDRETGSVTTSSPRFTDKTRALYSLLQCPVVYTTLQAAATSMAAPVEGEAVVKFDRFTLDRVIRLVCTGRSQIRKRIIQLCSILLLATKALSGTVRGGCQEGEDASVKRRKAMLPYSGAEEALPVQHLATLIDLARSLMTCDVPAGECLMLHDDTSIASPLALSSGRLPLSDWIEQEILIILYTSSCNSTQRDHPIPSFSSSASCSPARRGSSRTRFSSCATSSSDDASPWRYRFPSLRGVGRPASANISVPARNSHQHAQRQGSHHYPCCEGNTATEGASPQPALHSSCGIEHAVRIATNQRGVVILISGAAGSGKSTLACHLANRLGIANVMSTDTVRHVLRCRYAKAEENPFLFASTYDAGKHLTDEEVDAVIQKHGLLLSEKFSVGVQKEEAMEEERRRRSGASPWLPPSPYLRQQWEGMRAPGAKGVAAPANGNSPPIQFKSAFSFQGREEVRCIEGYKRQSELVVERLLFCVEQIVLSGDSVIVEGVHLFGSNIVRFFRRLAAVSCPCVAFLVRIPTERCHLKRFAARSQNFNTQPSCNKYVQHVKNIRLIQDYLVAGANAINSSALERHRRAHARKQATSKEYSSASTGAEGAGVTAALATATTTPESSKYHVTVIDNIAVASAIQLMHKEIIRLVLGNKTSTTTD